MQLATVFGANYADWSWQYAGQVSLPAGMRSWPCTISPGSMDAVYSDRLGELKALVHRLTHHDHDMTGSVQHSKF